MMATNRGGSIAPNFLKDFLSKNLVISNRGQKGGKLWGQVGCKAGVGEPRTGRERGEGGEGV